MMRFIGLLIFVLGGCPGVTPTPPSTPITEMAQLPAPACSLDAQVVPIGICPQAPFTANKFACAICPGVYGCTNIPMMVYCVTSCADALCVSIP